MFETIVVIVYLVQPVYLVRLVPMHLIWRKCWPLKIGSVLFHRKLWREFWMLFHSQEDCFVQTDSRFRFEPFESSVCHTMVDFYMYFCSYRYVRTFWKFTWERLATWINMTEVWPYRTSWIVLYIEETEDVDPKTLLKTVYQVSSHGI